ncbi:vWA domain-containing protein [Leptolyngbya sp. PCC 6406]|uniref:vWA domain-containing protein n=1 Tax=Leptolyngbya sp. PCC 6406 TaxID=1173264 RepID=UPI001CEC2727|nr:vWA domain-containing protein [Leptolyngbya sp. PCC 6406]
MSSLMPTLNRWIHRLTTRFCLWLAAGLSLALLWGCVGSSVPTIDSPETAEQVLFDTLLPKVSLQENFIDDGAASRYATDSISEPLPNLEDFPLYGATPSGNTNQVYIEILSSSEKANIDKQNERWLIEVADAFNRQGKTVASGQTIQVGIRQIPSGTAARLLAAGTIQPTGYSPSNDLWVEMLRSEGVNPTPVVERLVPNVAGFVLQKAAYDQLGSTVTFDQVVDAMISGQLTAGYPNPYTSSTSLNLLYHLFWRAAGHQADGQPLTQGDLESPEVNSVFAAFQEQVLITTTTTLDLQEIFIRDPDKLQAFPLEYQNYQSLIQLPGFEEVQFVPFGIPHNNPLVGFDWNSPEAADALAQFGAFASTSEIQDLARQQGFEPTDYLQRTDLPPIPTGEVLTAAQSYWKARKDGDRTVYLMAVVDTSGSMDGEPMAAVKEGLKIASSTINAGNQVGLITFADNTVYRVPLAPFDQLQHQRFLAAIDTLRADGATAMYDATVVGLAELMKRRQSDPEGRFYLLLLTDGIANRGYGFRDVKNLMTYSDIRIYPIAYGDVNEAELAEIAQLRESTVKTGTPGNVQDLLKGIFQTNL